MAENTDDLLEESTDNASDDDSKPKGLSTSLLIKVAIGLGVLLIVLIVAFLLFMPAEDKDAPAEDFQSQVEPVDEEMQKATDSSGDIELPPVEAPAESPADGPEPATPSNTSSGSTEEVLSEIIALQQQISSLQQENQTLIKQVEKLVQENDQLTAQVSQLSAERPSLDEVMTDERLVTDANALPDYRHDRYRNTPQPELAPKWGEFDELEQSN